MGSSEAKRALYEQFARIGKAVGHPARLELLDLLAQGERSVEELASIAGAGLSTVSAQLQELRRAQLVDTRREGTRIFYRLAGDDVAALLVAMRDVAAAHLGDVETAARRYLGDDTDVEAVDRDELRRRATAGEVIVVDVRPALEYRAGHIPGAMSIPIDELDERLAELPNDVEVIAYCRGPYCVFAHNAVRSLHRHGRRARRLGDGWPEWHLAGLPTELGSDPGRLMRGPSRAERDQRP